MEVALTPQQRQAAKREIVRQFEHGVSVEDVRGRSPVPMHRTTIYRLLKRAQREGKGEHPRPRSLFLLDRKRL